MLKCALLMRAQQNWERNYNEEAHRDPVLNERQSPVVRWEARHIMYKLVQSAASLKLSSFILLFLIISVFILFLAHPVCWSPSFSHLPMWLFPLLFPVKAMGGLDTNDWQASFQIHDGRPAAWGLWASEHVREGLTQSHNGAVMESQSRVGVKAGEALLGTLWAWKGGREAGWSVSLAEEIWRGPLNVWWHCVGLTVMFLVQFTRNNYLG